MIITITDDSTGEIRDLLELNEHQFAHLMAGMNIHVEPVI